MNNRNIMTFFLPASMTALETDNISNRIAIPMYINPQSFRISEEKIINETLTKGGYSIQYWGEKTPTLSVSGTTASAGAEAINILYDVYRHEQIQFGKDIVDRARQFSNSASEAFENTNTSTNIRGLSSIIGDLFDGENPFLSNGISSAIDNISDLFSNSDDRLDYVTLPPTLSAYAVSIDIYYNGVRYRGFFRNFNVNESAEKAGWFDYDFNFTVLKKAGRRKNFMPWHKNPYDSSGTPRVSSIPKEGQDIENLSFTTSTQYNITGTSLSENSITDQASDSEEISIPLNRFGTLK